MHTIRIPSFTAPGVSYAVGPRGVTMAIACDCPAFRRTRPCKHVRVYIAVEHAVARCRNAGHIGDLAPSVNVICPTCLSAVFVASALKSKSRMRAALEDLKAKFKLKRKKKRRQ